MWSLPKQDEEGLRPLLDISALEWENNTREARERRIVSPAGEPGQARPRALSFGRLVAALR